MKIKCSNKKCGHEWDYIPRKTDRKTTTCPKCAYKLNLSQIEGFTNTPQEPKPNLVKEQETKMEKPQQTNEKVDAPSVASQPIPEKQADAEQESPKEIEIAEEPQSAEPKASKEEFEALPYECPDCKCRFDALENGRCPNPACRAELEEPNK